MDIENAMEDVLQLRWEQASPLHLVFVIALLSSSLVRQEPGQEDGQDASEKNTRKPREQGTPR